MLHTSRWFTRVVSSVAVVLLCMEGVGCLAFPSKMRMRRYGRVGAQLQNTDVDTAFVEAGVTTRSEVAAKLAAIDVDSANRFFWGRWVESSWGVVGGSLPLSASAAPTTGSLRHWRYRNIIIKFNDQGVAVEQHRIDNEEILWRQLTAYMRESRTTWVPETLQISSIGQNDTYATLSADGLELKATNKKNSLTVAFPSPVTIRLRSRFRPQALSTPELTCFEMSIAGAGGGSKRSFESCASARQFLGILEYLDHLPPPARWQAKP